jgi:hypothetical protein
VRPPAFHRLTLTVLLGLTGALLAPARAGAATPAEEAEALVRQGNQLRSAGDDQNALPLFEKAVQVHPSYRTWAQLGLVEKALGRWAEADRHLTDALKGGQDPWIQKNVTVLEKTLAEVKRQVARIEITGEPVGAEVLVNGRPVGKVPLPQPVRVNAGTVDIELRAPGYKPTLRTVAVVGLQYQPVVIRLEREGTGDSSASPPPGGGPLSLGMDADRPVQPWRPWAVGGALAGAAVGIGVGVLGAVNHDQKVTDFNKYPCAEAPDGSIVNKNTGVKDQKCANLRASYKNAKTMAIVGFTAGAALGATALVLYLTTPSGGGGGETAMATAPVCAAGPGLVGLGCTLRF